MTCTVKVTNGPTITIPWSTGMNVQQALEEAYNAKPKEFTCLLQYFGGFGYLVTMINETYDSYISTANPFYYWEFLVNGTPASTGIDNTILNDNDIVTFDYQVYTAEIHADSTMHKKHALHQVKN